MRQNGHCVIDYIDDYIGVGVPDAASRSYQFLIDLMNRLGLTISKKKLVETGTLVMCLGVDSVQGTISIPEEKLQQVNKAVHEWLGKNVCTKRQHQSILGLLLYVHKCIKSAHVFLNRILELQHTENYSHSRFQTRLVLVCEVSPIIQWG